MNEVKHFGMCKVSTFEVANFYRSGIVMYIQITTCFSLLFLMAFNSSAFAVSCPPINQLNYVDVEITLKYTKKIDGDYYGFFEFENKLLEPSVVIALNPEQKKQPELMYGYYDVEFQDYNANWQTLDAYTGDYGEKIFFEAKISKKIMLMVRLFPSRRQDLIGAHLRLNILAAQENKCITSRSFDVLPLRLGKIINIVPSSD